MIDEYRANPKGHPLKIGEIYSHLNGLEFLEARKPALWDEVKSVIEEVDAPSCRKKVSKEKRTRGKLLYGPTLLNKAFKSCFELRRWKPVTTSYWVCRDAATNRRIVELPADQQRKEIEAGGFEALRSKNQTDFEKQRVAVEVQFGKYSFIAYDLIVKHLAFYVAGRIDVGIEIIPMKSLQAEMSSGPGYYEAELFNLVREGRGVPPVPIVLIGVEI